MTCPRPLRVLFVDHTSSLSGGEIALLDLIRHLDRQRVSPVVAVCREGGLVDALRADGVPCHVLPLDDELVDVRKDSLGVGSLLKVASAGGIVRYAMRLSRLIRDENIDLVHANSLKSDVYGALAARLARRPVVWHVRDRIDADYLPGSVAALFRQMCRWLPHRVIANSAATAQSLQLPAQRRAAIVYSGIDDALLAPAPPERPKSLTSADAIVRIGLVGRIAPWKGQHVFIEAAATIRRAVPHARFQIIGDAQFGEHDYEQRIRDRVQALGLDEALEFTGFCPDIHDRIRELDILVHASITAEPFGKVVVEGMAAGKPVVATAGGGILEIVEDGVTGRLVPMDDAAAMARAVIELLNDPAAAAAIGARGRERVRERFTASQAARQVEEIYNEMISRRRSGVSSEPVVAQQPAAGDVSKLKTQT